MVQLKMQSLNNLMLTLIQVVFQKLALKGGLLGVRSLYENVIAEPIRTIGLVQQGATFSEAYKKAQIEPFAYWREAKEKGKKS